MKEPHKKDWELFRNKLRNINAKSTMPRQIVFKILFEKNHEPISMRELLEMTNGSVDRTSIFRTVKLLQKAGIAKRIEVGWKYKLELSDDFLGHHHHLTCLKCRRVIIANANSSFENALIKFASENNFNLQDHDVTIKGLCKNCQNK